MATAEEIKAARDVIQTLLKAKKTIRMYPENNPVYAKTVDDIHARLADFFSYRDSLDLRIKQNEIFFDSEQVYFNPDKEDNLALFFFKDGLRELSFKREISREELTEFLKITALDFDREAVDDDIVTLLWERDFQNIRYVVDEAFLLEDDAYETKAVASLKEEAPEVDDLLRAYADSFNAEEVKEVAIVPLTDKDLQSLVREIERDQEGKTGKLSDILFEMLFLSDSPAELEDVNRFLADVMLYSLRHGDIRIVVDNLKRTQTVVAGASVPEALKGLLRRLPSMLHSADAMKAFGEILDSAVPVDDEVINELVQFLDRNAITPLIGLLGDIQGIRGRKQVISMLIHLGKKDLQALAKGLHDTRWFVVRNVIYILRHIGDKKAVEYLLSTARHSDPRVRKESIKALGELKSPHALQTLREFFDDPDSSIRKAAAKALGAIGSETAKRILMERITAKEFLKQDFEEKREIYEALSQWSDSDLIEFLLRQLRKTSLFYRARTDENRACAAHCLGLIGRQDALSALRKLQDASNPLLREYVTNAVRRIEHG